MSSFSAQKILNKTWWKKCRIPNPIRKLFEEGMELRKKFGENEVCDFSLGNPTLPPPDYFAKALAEIARNPPDNLHTYMPNQGRLETRTALARVLSKWYDYPLEAKNLILTVGAASALTILFHAILNPGDEVIVIVPYFLGYDSYVSNPGGVVVRVKAQADFDLDIDAIEKGLTPKTRVVLVNSPNNPTGKVYSAKSIRALAALLTRVYESRLAAAAAAEEDEDSVSPILLVSDEPYRRLSYLSGSRGGSGSSSGNGSGSGCCSSCSNNSSGGDVIIKVREMSSPPSSVSPQGDTPPPLSPLSSIPSTTLSTTTTSATPANSTSPLEQDDGGLGGDGLPSMFKIYPYSVVCSSFSKDLSIPGERMGFLAMPPTLYSDDLVASLAGAMRDCGFVNAPSFMQFALEKTIDNEVTCVPWYRERRDLLYAGLCEAGLDCPLPEGAFYLFPKVPQGVTDVEFSDLLRAELVLSVPGSCFGDPSGVRFAYCVSLETIRTAIPRIAKVVEAIKARK